MANATVEIYNICVCSTEDLAKREALKVYNTLLKRGVDVIDHGVKTVTTERIVETDRYYWLGSEETVIKAGIYFETEYQAWVTHYNAEEE